MTRILAITSAAKAGEILPDARPPCHENLREPRPQTGVALL